MSITGVAFIRSCRIERAGLVDADGCGVTRVSDRRGSNLHWFRNRTSYYRKHYGRLAERWLLTVIWLWGWECGLRIRLGPRDPQAKREALARLLRSLP